MNKFSLTQMSKEEFDAINKEFGELLDKHSAHVIPISEYVPLEKEQGMKTIAKIVFMKKVEIPAEEPKKEDGTPATE